MLVKSIIASAFKHFSEERRLLRHQLARFVGARSEEIAFVPNTSSGVLAIALCFPWQAGDKLVCFDGEFPSNVTPWQRAAELYDLQLEFQNAWAFLEEPSAALDALEAVLQEGVRLVAVSAVQFQSGLRMPLKALSSLCHEYGAKLFVDGIQACGVVPLDVVEEDIDFMSVGSHKWLMGLEGSAFLYVKEELQSALNPVTASWLSHEDPLQFLFEGEGHLRYDRPIRSRIDFLEFGAQNTPGQLSLGVSVALIQQIGVEAIYEHVQRYNDRLEKGLRERGFTSLRASWPGGRSGILSVRVPYDCDVGELSHRLNKQGVACTSPDGLVRFAPHWPNSQEEVPVILEVIDEFMRGALR